MPLLGSSLVNYPDINGNRYGWSSIEIGVAGNITLGVKDINYENALEPGEVRGTKSYKLGRTRGELKSTASLTMYKLEWLQMIRNFGPGYMEYVFDVTVSYADTGQPTTTDIIVGCRIKKHADEPKQGSEPATVKIDLDVFYVEEDGMAPTVDITVL